MDKLNVRHTLGELCALIDLPKRKVKFYIEKGMIDRPEGAKKGAFYTQRHVEQLLEIKKWQQVGLSLERIKTLLNDKDALSILPPPIPRQPGDVDIWSHIYIQEGIELHVEPRRSGLTPEQVDQLCQALQSSLITTSDNS